MDNDQNNRKDNNPTSPKRKEINPASRTWEGSRNPDSDNDRKGRNVDIDKENQGNEISGREQQTTPKNKVGDVVDRFSSREQQQTQENKNNERERS